MKSIDLDVVVAYGEHEKIVGRYHLKYTQSRSIQRMHTQLLNQMMREYPDWREIQINNREEA